MKTKIINTQKDAGINKLSRIHLVLSISLLTVIASSCEDFVATEPPKNELVSETLYTSDAVATSAVIGIYSEMMSNQSFFGGGIFGASYFGGLSSDEFVNRSAIVDRNDIFANSLTETNSVTNLPWQGGYKHIYHANAVLEGLLNSKGLTNQTKNQLEGEAKFVRAFVYLYLINFYGDVPLLTTTDYKVNAVMPRFSVEDVYQQIISDLQDAENLLGQEYVTPGRVRPNRSTARALLARVYLYRGEWANAETQASTLLDDVTYGLEENLNDVFLNDSEEAIWQLMPVVSGRNTWDATTFISSQFGPSWIYLSDPLLSSFETEDNRYDSWVNNVIVGTTTYYYPYKYKINTFNAPLSEYFMVLRLAEQYLIRAEARAHQNKLSEAIQDIDKIRERAGLPLIQDTNPAIDQDNLLIVIDQERRVELFSEWGHRWIDLKRTNKADAVLSIILEKDWQETDVLYPIPYSERSANPSLNQNFGY